MSELDAGSASRILRAFGVDAEPVGIEPLGRGHIHRTLVCRTDDGRAWVLQRINTDVFTDLDALATATCRVERHLEAARSEGRYRLELPRTLAPADPAAPPGPWRDPDGDAWRVTPYLANTVALERTDDPDRARRAARAFAHFAAALADLDPDTVPEVLPRFHDPAARLAALERAVADDAVGRAATCAGPIERVRAAAPRVERFLERVAAERRRVCHNDTKLNNLLFDADGGFVRAVIDLDTAMPGLWAYDFGDLVRSVAASGPEDATDLDATSLRDDLLAAIAEGYAGGLGDRATPAVRASLWDGVWLMPLMLGARFLTDHLQGDRYFPVDHPDHNLERARCQLALHADAVAREAILRPIVAPPARS